VVCPACQRDSTTAAVCSYCGAPLVNPASGTSTGDPFSTEPENRGLRVLKILLLIGAVSATWILVCYLAYVRTARWSRGVLNGESTGYFVGSVFTPLLIAMAIVWLIQRGQKKTMSTARRNLLTALLALGVSLVAFAGSLQKAPAFDESKAKLQMGHLMKQAAGNEPATPDGEWYEGPSREFFRDILNFNQQYTGAMQSAKGASMAKLYTPESYATRAGMQTTVTQLRAMLDVDRKYESMEPLIKKLEVRVYATRASQAEKEAFLNGLRGSFSKSLAPRNETMRVEEEWLQSSIDLYVYTLAHSADYSVRGKKLVFRAGVSPVEFQSLQSKAIEQHKVAVDAKHKLDAARQTAMSQTGLTPADLSAPSREK